MIVHWIMILSCIRDSYTLSIGILHNFFVFSQMDKPSFVCWILGRLSFEKHVEPGALFDSVEEEYGITIICIVMSKTWNKIPDIYSRRKNTYLCWDFDEVIIS